MIGLPPHAAFPITGMCNFSNGTVLAPSFALHTASTLIEIHPRLIGLLFAKCRVFRTLRFHLAGRTTLAFFWLNQGSLHCSPFLLQSEIPLLWQNIGNTDNNVKTVRVTARNDFCYFIDLPTTREYIHAM